MATDVDDLPELDEQDTYTAAVDALESARERMEEIREEIPEAKAEVERLTEEVDETRVAMAAGDATEDDLDAAKQELSDAEGRLSDLREEQDAQEEAISRLETRVDEARDDAAGTIAGEYSEVGGQLMKQKSRVMKQLATCLEKIDALKQKAAANGLRRDERVRVPAPTVKTRAGKTVGADRLRHLAGKLDERTE